MEGLPSNAGHEHSSNDNANDTSVETAFMCLLHQNYFYPFFTEYTLFGVSAPSSLKAVMVEVRATFP